MRRSVVWRNLTSDIPNVSEEATKDLDETWYRSCRCSALSRVISMIGKITPKGESDPSPEEKLLACYFR